MPPLLFNSAKNKIMNLKPFLKTASVLFIAFLISISVHGQTWNTVGQGLPYHANYIAFHMVGYDSQAVYVAYFHHTGIKSEVSMWDGLSWKSTPILQNTQIFSDFLPNGEIVKMGANLYISNGTLLKFDGSSWSTVSPPGFSGSVTTLEFVNGELLCGGSFTANGGIHNLMKYDGITFSAMPPAPWLNNVYDIFKFNNSLYITGRKANSNTIDSVFLKLNASNVWEGPANFFQGTGGGTKTLRMIEFQNKLFFVDYSYKLFELRNDTIAYVDSTEHINTDAVVYNNNLYISGYRGLGIHHLSKFDGTSLKQLKRN